MWILTCENRTGEFQRCIWPCVILYGDDKQSPIFRFGWDRQEWKSFCQKWSRDQPQTTSSEAEEKEAGNEVGLWKDAGFSKFPPAARVVGLGEIPWTEWRHITHPGCQVEFLNHGGLQSQTLASFETNLLSIGGGKMNAASLRIRCVREEILAMH